jgi:hypothetical protein
MRKTLIFSLALSCLVSGCITSPPKRRCAEDMRAEELLAIVNPMTDCEWKAAYRYDDGSRSVDQLAEQILGVCTVERLKVRQALCLSLNDPHVDLDEFKEAVQTVEHVREGRVRGK